MRTSFSRRELYALGEMLGDSVTRKEGGRIIYGGGGGGGGRAAPTETTNTTYNTNIPEYAKPYVETMLAGTQKQLFQTAPNAETGATEITGFQPYKAYGGTYDTQGNQTSYDPGKAVAGFQPLQETAQRGIAGMQMPGEFQQAGDVTRAGITSAMGNYYNPSQFGVQQVGTQNYTGNNVSQYMNPYMQNVVDIQQREAQRQGDIAGTQRAGQAVRSGAFGGSRAGLLDAEAARNLATQKGDIQAQGQNAAFQNAQQQFNAQQQANLQAQTANQGAGLQAQQMGEQSRQYGAGYGMQNLQAGMQGAQQLAGLGQAGLASQQGIYNMQNTVGAQQQGLEQQKINQAMTDYANAQQYPLMQLGTMSNMLRGLPMQAQTTNQYAAAPNQTTQAIGTAGAAASLYNALKAKGGVIEEKKMASGGIASVPSYDVGGEVYADLMKMGPEELQAQIKNSSSEKVKEMAKSLLKQKQMAGGGIVAFAEGPPKDRAVEEDYFGSAMQKPASDWHPGDQPANLGVPPNPQPPAPAPAPAGITQAKPPEPTTGVGTLQATRETIGQDYNKPMTERIAEKQALYKEMGVGAPGAEQREKLMAERANAADEAERTKWMRAAKFFASWGSTPGSTLVAGMAAVRESVPDMINDAKEAKKIRMEMDKTIAGLDEATRLEKKGFVDEAYAEKMKLGEKMQALNIEIAKIQAHEQIEMMKTERAEKHDISQGALQEKIHRLDNETKLTVANMQAQIHAGEKQMWNESKWQQLLTTAVHEKNAVEAKVANLRADPKYTTAMETVTQFKGKELSPAQQKMFDVANATVTSAETSIKTMQQDAAENYNIIREKVRGKNKPPATTTDKPKGGATPALPPGAKLD